MSFTFRSGGHNGVWCCFLLPWAIIGSKFDTQTITLAVYLCISSLNIAYHLLYRTVEEGSIVKHFACSVMSDLFERAHSKDVRVHRRKMSRQPNNNIQSKQGDNQTTFAFNCCLMISFVCCLWLWHGLSLFPCSLAVILLWFYHTLLLPGLFKAFPNSFTFGEGAIVAQGLCIFIYTSVLSLYNSSDDVSTVYGSFALIARTGLLSCVIMCLLPYVPGFHWTGKNPWFIPLGTAFFLGCTLPYNWWVLRRESLVWLLGMVWECNIRLSLSFVWLISLFMAIGIVRMQTKPATTALRKSFHLIMVLNLTLGILLDPNFTYLASAIAFSFFILSEALRVHKIEPFASMIRSGTINLLDEKDQGKLILTHIYLFVGCFVPMWLSRDLTKTHSITLLSGLLSIGIGDSAASVIGSKFGRTKFPDSKKSLEGTLASVLCQLAYLWILQYVGMIEVPSWTMMYLPIVVVSLVEALTNQIDNLVLPIILYSLFESAKF